MNNKKEKALALYSGGLDSRLIIKLLKEKGIDVTAIHYKLPFISDKEITDDFLENEMVKLIIIDCKQGDYLKKYINILKHPKYGVGAGANPCIDCKIYMFERAKQYAIDNGYDYLATGEVPGQRPMSQLKKVQELIDRDVDFEIIRPLADIGINGRGRDKQLQMVKEYGGFHFPAPGGGCLLCEKGLKHRFQTYLKHDMIQEDTLQLMSLGRHFFDADSENWLIVARDGAECQILEAYNNCLPSEPKTPAVFYKNINDSNNNEVLKLARDLQKAYITGADKSLRKQFSSIKL